MWLVPAGRPQSTMMEVEPNVGSGTVGSGPRASGNHRGSPLRWRRQGAAPTMTIEREDNQGSATGTLDVSPAASPGSNFRKSLKRFSRDRMGMLGVAIILAFLVATVISMVWTPYPFDQPELE